jgi:hypothetical protein
MLFKAIQEARTFDQTDAIAEALEKTKIRGPLGDLAFNERHIVVHGYDFCNFVKGTPKCEYVAP